MYEKNVFPEVCLSPVTNIPSFFRSKHPLGGWQFNSSSAQFFFILLFSSLTGNLRQRESLWKGIFAEGNFHRRESWLASENKETMTFSSVSAVSLSISSRLLPL